MVRNGGPTSSCPGSCSASGRRRPRLGVPLNLQVTPDAAVPALASVSSSVKRKLLY